MKTITIVLLFLTFSFAYGQEDQDKIIELRDSNSQLQKLIKNKELTIEILEQRLEQASNTIANQNFFLNNFGVIYVIITIIVGILAFGLPLAVYLLGLKPTQKELEKLENKVSTELEKLNSIENKVSTELEKLDNKVTQTLKNSFESYFEELRKKKQSQFLSMLEDRRQLPEVSDYFQVHGFYQYEEDIVLIINFLSANKDVDKEYASQFNHYVIESGFLIAEKYYRTILDNDEEENLIYAIYYFVKNDFESHLSYIEKIIKTNEKGHHLLIKFFNCIQQEFIGCGAKKMPEKLDVGIKYVKSLFDNDNILKAIEDKEIPEENEIMEGCLLDFMDFKTKPIINFLDANDYLRETKYYKKYLEEKDKKPSTVAPIKI